MQWMPIARAVRATRIAISPRFANPYIAARMGYLDDVIEPIETRPRVIEAFAVLRTKRETRPPKKHGNIPL